MWMAPQCYPRLGAGLALALPRHPLRCCYAVTISTAGAAKLPADLLSGVLKCFGRGIGGALRFSQGLTSVPGSGVYLWLD